MRTHIDIDDELMADAMKASGLKTKNDTVELGLKTLVQLAKRSEIKALKGRLSWSGDLEEMRCWR